MVVSTIFACFSVLFDTFLASFGVHYRSISNLHGNPPLSLFVIRLGFGKGGWFPFVNKGNGRLEVWNGETFEGILLVMTA